MNFMKLLSTILSTLVLTSILAGNAFAELGDLSNNQLKQMMADNVVMVDIRRADEWQQSGVIEGSHLLTFFDKKGHYDIEKWLTDLSKIVDKNDKLVLICRSGNRTGTVGKFLDQKLGFPQVYHLKKGISRWDGSKKQLDSAKVFAK
jgi:rhodanese-related sulfurtransferase